MKAVRITLGVLGVLLVIFTAGLFFLADYLDKHQDLLERTASEALGREVRIEGGVAMHWSMTPSIALEGVWVANAEWASGEYLARAERAVLQFDVAALLQRGLDIRQITLVNADIRLETGSEGRQNWALGDKTSTPVALQIDRFECEDSRLHYRPMTGQEQQLAISDLELVGFGGADVSLKARLNYRDLTVSVSATAHSDPADRSAGTLLKGRMTSGDAVMDFTGHATAPLEFADLDVTLRMDQLDLLQLLGKTSPALPVTGPLEQIKASLKSAGGTTETLIGNLSGELEIGSSRFALSAKPGGEAVDVSLTGTRISMAPGQPVVLQTGLLYEKQPFQLELTGGTLAQLITGGKTWKTIKVKAQGQFNGKPLEIAGQIGSSSAVLAGRDLDVDLVVRHTGLQARVDGRLAKLDGLAGSRFNVKASGPSLSRLSPWTGMDMPKTEPFTFAARLQGSEQRVDLKNIKTRVGAIDVAGDMQIPLRQGGRIKGTLRSDLLDLSPFIATGDPGADNSEAILAWELAPDALQYRDAALRLEVGRFRGGDFGFEDVTLDASLANGHLKLTMLDRAESLNMTFDLKPEAPDWRLRVRDKSKMDLGSLVETEKNQDERSRGPITMDVDLSGRGRSLGSVLGSAKGHVGMVLGAGQLSKEVSDRLPLGSVLESVLGAIDSKGKTESRSSLECAVVQLDVVDGIATSRDGLALRTDTVNVLGGGTIKLDTGEIDLHFKTAQRKGLGISILGLADNFIHLTGTLRQPGVEMNAVGFLTHGGAAWATGGLSLLYDSLSRRLTASSNPCESVLKAGASQQD